MLPLSVKPTSHFAMPQAPENRLVAEETPLLVGGEEKFGVASEAAPLASAPMPAPLPGKARNGLPQAIAHRGYKAAFPENTMAAFRSAVDIGAHAIETDLHLSKDGVVVLSHDASLKRCFGEATKIADCDWSYLSTLRTLREPREPMPRLVDLLEYLAQPGLEDVWVLLDIKKDDDKHELLSRVAKDISSVSTSRPWSEKIIMGCWDASYVEACLRLLPGLPLAFIGWSLIYARELLPVPNLNFNMFQLSIDGSRGARFLKDVQEDGRAVFVWTVNKEDGMERSIRKGLDGVITDDPKLFLEVCDRWGMGGVEGKLPARSQPCLRRARYMTLVLIFRVFAMVAALVFVWRHGYPRRHVRKALQG